jgi:hypothetical protein
MVLYVCVSCLLHSRFIENHPIWIPEDGPLISKVVLSPVSWLSLKTKVYGFSVVWPQNH